MAGVKISGNNVWVKVRLLCRPLIFFAHLGWTVAWRARKTPIHQTLLLMGM